MKSANATGEMSERKLMASQIATIASPGALTHELITNELIRCLDLAKRLGVDGTGYAGYLGTVPVTVGKYPGQSIERYLDTACGAFLAAIGMHGFSLDRVLELLSFEAA